MIKKLLLFISYVVVFGFGFGAGIYMLPILIAPESPSVLELERSADRAIYSSVFVRDLTGSDAFHWGEGTVYLSPDKITFIGELAPGPDYQLYLTPTFVEDEEQFFAVKSDSVRVDVVRTFDGFVIAVPNGINIRDFEAVTIWCEHFSEFITSGKYR